MKISARNTAIGLLNKMDTSQFRIISDDGETTFDEKMRLGHSIANIWPNLQPKFSKRVQYMSEAFYQAYEKAAHKMGSVLDKEDMDESGTLIYRASQSEVNTVFYWIRTWGKGADYEMDATVMIFNKDSKKDKPALGILCQRRPGMPLGAARFYGSTSALKAGVTPTSVLSDTLSMVLFIKYCPLETKTIKAGSKDACIGVKYVNESKSPIQILDSTWFTTIVKSEGFHVRGHFRFQPCGQGLKDRKLIWIEDFDKEGYTRTAKVLNQQ